MAVALWIRPLATPGISTSTRSSTTTGSSKCQKMAITCNNYEDSIRTMKQWIQNRIAWIDQQFLPAPSLSRQESSPLPGVVLIMQTPKGEIYYTTDGTDPRQAGGAISSSAHRYH